MRPVARLAFQCIGYPDYRATRHAGTCRGTMVLTENQAHYRLAKHAALASQPRCAWGTSGRKVPEHAGFLLDLETLTFRCDRCILASRGVAVAERRLRDIGVGVGADRLRSREERTAELRAHSAVMVPKFIASQPKASAAATAKLVHELPNEAAKVARKRGTIAAAFGGDDARVKGGSVNVAVRACQGCGKLTLCPDTAANRSGRWHQRCLLAFQKSLAGSALARAKCPLPVPAPKRGHQPVEDRRREFAWAVCHYLGNESFRSIAKRARVSHVTVALAVEGIIAALPEPGMVEKRFRPHVEYLRALAAGEPPRPEVVLGSAGI